MMLTQEKRLGFLKAKGAQIVDPSSKPVVLRGVNLGGWLMMEGYILHAPNRAEQIFKKNFARTLGPKALLEFEKEFRNNFIREEDFKTIRDLGFNCIRLPFNCRLIESKPYSYDRQGAACLDRAVGWAKKNGLWVILDLHAAPGAQNHDWHSDSLGPANLWVTQKNQQRTFALWEFLADRYRDESTVAGYDLLNESVTDDTDLLNTFYEKLIKRIRRVDRHHILFVEGNKWATDADCLKRFDDDNWALSIHTYQPIDFTFNLVAGLSYPLNDQGAFWNKKSLRKTLSNYAAKSRSWQVPVFVGEFGVNAREGLYREGEWVKDMLECFGEFGFHWTYWTYKAIKNSIFPDGIFSYRANPPWVNRQGFLTGWETYAQLWPQKKQEIMESWRTKHFTPNKEIVKVISDACQ